ncbi:MAG: hypothetical protein KF900_12985 [Bacteroidetes bacterium]|nr:hypothetical protein [Bacteroidota bacterium]
MNTVVKYKISDFTIVAVVVIALLLSYVFVWKNTDGTFVNYVGGDAKFYYEYLHSTFIKNFVLNDGHNGNSLISHHPVGVSALLLPFFLLALITAPLFGYEANGVSEPFQVSVCLAAIFYVSVGLIYLKKLFQLNNISDKISALVIALIFLGTNLLHYTITESGMSHVYSFAFIALFLYHSCSFVNFGKNKHLIFTALVFGIILLLRPNNGLIIFSILFWFKSKTQAVAFFKNLFRNKTFYYALLIPLLFGAFQVLVWAVKENQLFVNRYAPYGFDWLHPHFFQMLFGFNAGFFVYAPLCFLFLFGLISVYRQNKFLFYSATIFLLGLFYFLSAYSAYTYYDGFGTRVLVDFYSVFALLGAKLFSSLQTEKFLYITVLAFALFFVLMNVVYSYQARLVILPRSGTTYNQWKYIFFKTNKSYEHVLGGSNDLTPYSKEEANIVLEKNFETLPFDYSEKDFGVIMSFDSIGFTSNRVQIKINVNRTEAFANASKDAVICIALEDKQKQNKTYSQFKLNETPANNCCGEKEYFYQATVYADFKPSDKLSVYVWNINKQAFSITKFSTQVYNYNYQLN